MCVCASERASMCRPCISDKRREKEGGRGISLAGLVHWRAIIPYPTPNPQNNTHTCTVTVSGTTHVLLNEYNRTSDVYGNNSTCIIK